MTTKFSFTDGRLSALQATSDRVTYRDEKTPGLSLRVSPAGGKAFYLSLWYDGKNRWVKLGSFPAMTVKQAREEYTAKRAAIGANGEVAMKAAIKRVTLSSLWDQYTELNPDGQSQRTIKNRRYFFAKHIAPAIGGKFLHEVQPDDIEAIKSRLVKVGSGRNANELLIILRVLYKWATRMRMLPPSFPSPAAAVKQAKVNRPRSRRLHSDEFRAFMGALDKYSAPGYRETAADAFRMMLFTGARSANVKQMEWSEINLDLGVWSIPAAKTKTERDYTVPLTSQAVEILQRRHAGPAGTSDYVFPGTQSPYLQSLRRSWISVLALAGLDGLTIHDLRRTQGSVQADLGVNLALIGASLCHDDIKSTAGYTHAAGIGKLRENMERANRSMTAVAAGTDQLALTVEDWQEIVVALGDSPLAAKVQMLADAARVA